MDYRIEDLPSSERPREKLSREGPESLTSVELLAIILRTGTRGANVKQISGEILKEYSLSELSSTPPDDFKKFHGVSRVKAGQLAALGELSRRMKKEEREKIQNFQDVKDRCRDMKFLSKEKLRIFCLNSGNQILEELEYEGDTSKLEIETRECLKDMVRTRCVAAVLAHNHPSGNTEFTEKDLKFTQDMIESLSKVGIELLDHAVVGDGFESMKRSTEIFKSG